MRDPAIIKRLGAFIAPGDPEPAQLAVGQQVITAGLAAAMNIHGWAPPPLAVAAPPTEPHVVEVRAPSPDHADAATELAETIATELATAGLDEFVHEVWVVIDPDTAPGYFVPGHPPTWVGPADT